MSIEASAVVEALEQMWRAIRARHADVPAVMVTLGAGSVGVPRGVLRLGHFAAGRWEVAGDSIAELFVGGEGLRAGASSVLATMLHEASHGVAWTRRIKDTSRGGRYHNKRFRDLGVELGLTITAEPQLGWNGTALSSRTPEVYSAELEDLAAALVTWRHVEGALSGSGDDGSAGDSDDAGGRGGVDAGGSARRPKNGVVLSCACPRRIRLSATAHEAGPVLCGVCGSEFGI